MEVGKIKLYKFRPLGTCKDFHRTKDIIETKIFWCSSFLKLNDPMEGVFQITDFGDKTKNIVKSIYKGKIELGICAFSGPEAFKNPAMWGYYANGFNGIAIEIEVEKNKVTMVEYTNSIPEIPNNHNCSNAYYKRVAKKILSRKYRNWAHENEYRFFHNKPNKKTKIGEIKSVYYNAVLDEMGNSGDLNPEERKSYSKRIKCLRKKDKSIEFLPVRVSDNGEVERINNSSKPTEQT